MLCQKAHQVDLRTMEINTICSYRITKKGGKEMSWIHESKRTWLEKFCINVLKSGPIPKHVALIMDGNRRYAVRKGMEKLQGHAFGFNKLSETLEWCLDLGITEVTVYTFSIENFKRPKEEVNCLMNLAREKFRELLKEKEKLEKYGVCIRIFGNIKLLPVDIQMLVAEAVLHTYNNTKTYLNVCLAYTSREEITNAVKDVALEVVSGNLKECDISEKILDQSLYSRKSTNPDIIVRTSGEIRLSDFLLWQSSYSVLSFLKVLWPDFTIWHLFLAVLFYQHNYEKLKEINNKHSCKIQHEEEQLDIQAAVQQYESKKTVEDNTNFESEILRIRNEMNERRNKFLDKLDKDRYEELLQIKEGNTIQLDPPFA
ncbi:dehydrodolichyl diphosphate synthase complex subunit DHDDS-like isoform X2 [Argiope bruennichi]|nr:dehydrodolichyl diphosphate synthase complex subunit DHDDS-like isoform X2 [Argiope bruennichi]XP_055946191.1 dehydrodolichyl diphosphate synthase complex subunit DHDDS-like isoform X2 [Argiope bruennichi]